MAAHLGSTLVALCVLITGVYGQGCRIPTAEEVDGNGGLVSLAWAESFGGEATALPDVQLIDFSIVCLATSERSGLYRRISLVANHTCQSLKSLPCDEGPVVAQFTFSCNDGVSWDPAISGTAVFAVRRDPLATLATSLRTDCFSCIHPEQTSRTDIDQVTHCIPCAAECRSNGSGQCILSGCCPFFESDGEGCVDQCGPNQQQDQEFICQDLEPVTTTAPPQPTTEGEITTTRSPSPPTTPPPQPTTREFTTSRSPSPPTTLPPQPITSAPPILRNHTVIGDPLFTVPILINGNQDSLCYEIHGRASQYFNLISDSCVSVSATYVEVRANSTNELFNVIGEVGVLAVDSAGECVRISIEAESCRAAVNSVPLDVMYVSQGVRVRQGRSYARVSVPNCADSALTMWALCRSLEGNAMIKFVVTRGINLRETSHGLIGQFWNVPYSISSFEGQLRDSEDSIDRVFMVSMTNPSGDDVRTFPVWREDLTWEGQNEPCLYAGNRQGGVVYEVLGEQDSVIEGNYADYRVQGLYETRFRYSHFNNTLCK